MTSTVVTHALPMHRGIWMIDNAHTTVAFAVRHLGLSKVRGRFDTVAGRLDVGDDLESSSVEARIAIDSLTTGNVERDLHLASTDFLDRSTHPDLTFSSSKLRARGELFVMTGDLTIRDITNSIELDVEFFGTSTNPLDGSERAGFYASGSFSRRSFGIEFDVALAGDKVLIADKVHLELDVEVVAQDVAGADSGATS